MEKYSKISRVGKGSFGTVWLVKSRRNESERHILKEVSLKGLPPSERKATMNEVAVLQKLHHPYIVAYRESFIERDQLGKDLAWDLRVPVDRAAGLLVVVDGQGEAQVVAELDGGRLESDRGLDPGVQAEGLDHGAVVGEHVVIRGRQELDALSDHGQDPEIQGDARVLAGDGVDVQVGGDEAAGVHLPEQVCIDQKTGAESCVEASKPCPITCDAFM